MEAVAIGAEVFADVLKNGSRKIEGTGCTLVLDSLMEEITDWRMEMEAARRLSNPAAKYYTEEEAWKQLGITREEVEAAEDLEIELEDSLPG